MSGVAVKTICFFACHAGPADHFADFAERLIKEGYKVHVCATSVATDKFVRRKIPVEWGFELRDGASPADLEAQAAQVVQLHGNDGAPTGYDIAITDVGHVFAKYLHKALAQLPNHPLHRAYYDNPKTDVPGDYWKTAAEVMSLADRVLFANADLATAALPGGVQLKDRVGLGYFPLTQAQELATQRAERHDSLRSGFFERHKIHDKGQKVLVYFGGNNDEYFKEALPAFQRFLSEAMSNSKNDLSNLVIVFQQHPTAKNDKRPDAVQFSGWSEAHRGSAKAPTCIVSDTSSSVTQLFADGALYYQTSMSSLFALAGIPTLQVGHKKYEDLLVKAGLTPSVTTSAALLEKIAAMKAGPLGNQERQDLLKSLGMRDNWFDILKRALIGDSGRSLESGRVDVVDFKTPV